MPTCLLSLGSNLGEREATIAAAIGEITVLPDVQLAHHSKFYRSPPIGGPQGQGEFLNTAAVIETKIAPLTLLHELQSIEARHGRERAERWAQRTLDIDLLLYGNSVSETPMLTVPHPRLTFRKFVLEPAAEIAPKMLHPVIGWPIERFLLHLENASDLLAIVSPSESLRQQLAELAINQFGLRPTPRPTFDNANHHWPPLWTTWLEVPTVASIKIRAANQSTAPPYAAALFPKLSVMLDADIAHRGADKLQWSTIVRQPGRGPTLRLQTLDTAEIEMELLAAINAVWPDLGPQAANRLKSQ